MDLAMTASFNLDTCLVISEDLTEPHNEELLRSVAKELQQKINTIKLDIPQGIRLETLDSELVGEFIHEDYRPDYLDDNEAN